MPAELPMPRDERLFRAARELMLSHRWEATLIDMADIANMSERTFPRHFYVTQVSASECGNREPEYIHH